MRQNRLTPKKIKNLVAKALKDKPNWKPSKGKVYLKSLKAGQLFNCGNMKGVFIESNPSSSMVVIIDYYGDYDLSSYYMGKQRFANKTEVIVKEKK